MSNAVDQEFVSKSHFKARALEFFRQVEASGAPVVVTDKGLPTVEIRRYKADQRSPLARLKGSVVEYKKPLEPIADEDWEMLT
ncbi:type II toxin-antitoxin system Phd/YefM family antitoxin [Maribrevibacterium harenarium]|uniref:Type II toxin-antitoxin system Phd/YefM family antitoxin n=1 Tax=Maribrevibacterium harenarium TaxID=2589817 RepID=A0A501WDZ7_9GAMM|nr:type II toxin-antitoxin system Phd/YefM family antitoxin [Maribrevibacterium harenarium]TPE48113.1 type II toxin-antitoxin system Phd/YefM family antitoxin [Maribrevibacterium harenarium]